MQVLPNKSMTLRNPTKTPTPPTDDAEGDIDENDLYDWGYANENDDVLGVEEDAPGTAGEEPIDEYDEEGYAPL
jgi:hypothetical protein